MGEEWRLACAGSAEPKDAGDPQVLGVVVRAGLGDLRAFCRRAVEIALIDP